MSNDNDRVDYECAKHSRRDFISASLATLALGISASAQTNSRTKDQTSAVGNGELKIAILLFDKITALDAVGPYEVLSRLSNARVYFVGETAGLKRTDTKVLALNADYTLADIPNPDVLLIPGGNVSDAMGSEKTLAWIREAHKTTKFTTSVCTGSLVLGAAGLLKGKKATTHWAVAKMLPAHGAEYVAERYVQAEKIITAAGVSAGIDMALFLVEQLAGRKTAEMIQLSVEYDPHPPVNSGSLTTATKETVEATQRYFQERRNKK